MRAPRMCEFLEWHFSMKICQVMYNMSNIDCKRKILQGCDGSVLLNSTANNYCREGGKSKFNFSWL